MDQRFTIGNESIATVIN